MTPADEAKIKAWLLDIIELYETQRSELIQQMREQLLIQRKSRWWYHRQLRASLGIPVRRRRCKLSLEECKRRIAAMEAAAR